MKKTMLFLAGLTILTLFLVSCQEGAVAGEATKIKASAVPTINLEIKNVQKIVQDKPEIRKVALKLNTLDPKILTRIAGEIERCNVEPSCSSPNYEVTSTECSDFEAMGGGVESCYICSVREDLRLVAECPEGWEYSGYGFYSDYPQGVSWDPDRFNCVSHCVLDCNPTRDNPQIECINRCPSASTLEAPCPEGFIYSPGDSYYSTTNRFSCIMLGDRVGNPICNQCGSDGFGANAGNGDVFCMIRS